ncbi:BRO-N domain-containing protein [Xanthobacter albus]|uniref:hypothetical protein n=1 Tax=Xanthobacter albus TaxID=3119929 RepID=UPI00372D1CB4
MCRALGVYLRADGGVNTTAALTKLGSDERMNLPYVEAKRIGLQAAASRVWGVSLISESGLYKLIMRSDKPEAYHLVGSCNLAGSVDGVFTPPPIKGIAQTLAC